MRTTTRWGILVPDSLSDPDEVPTHLGDAADQIDGLFARFMHGSYSSLPPAGNVDTYYYVDSGGTNLGGLYRDNGTAWVRVNPPVTTSSSDITTASFGDSPDAGATGLLADAGHRHGMMVNPLTAHLAASNPHPQYLLGAGAGSYYEKLNVIGNLGGTPTFDLSQYTQFKGTINASISSMTFSNPAPTGNRQQFGLLLTHDATSNIYTVAWPSSFDWGAAGAPTIPGTNGAIFISGFTDNAGSKYYVANMAFGGF